MYLLSICCGEQMLSLLLTKATLLLDLVKEETGSLFWPFFYILVHVVCFQIYFLNLSPSLCASSRPLLLQPLLASQTHSFLPIKTVQI